MSLWNECNKKICANFISDKYCHLFSMPKKKFRKFLNGFSVTQLKECIRQKHEKEVKRSFKGLSFYGTLIKKSYTKCLDKADMLRELPFYNELNIVNTSKPFKGYGRSYSVEAVDSKHPRIQLTIIGPSIKDLFKYL